MIAYNVFKSKYRTQQQELQHMTQELSDESTDLKMNIANTNLLVIDNIQNIREQHAVVEIQEDNCTWCSTAASKKRTRAKEIQRRITTGWAAYITNLPGETCVDPSCRELATHQTITEQTRNRTYQSGKKHATHRVQGQGYQHLG